MGDFNDLLSHDEKKKGCNTHPNSLMFEFREAYVDSNLIGIRLLGYPYTWIKRKGSPNEILEKLEHALVISN